MLVRNLIQKKSCWIKFAWISLIERSNIANAALVHFTSELEAKDASALMLSIKRSCVVPNGIDMAPFGGDVQRDERSGPIVGEKPFLLFVGRINWKKGLDRLIAALPAIANCRLVLAGNDEEGYRPLLERLATRAGVRERIDFVGSVYGKEKAALYRRALLLVLPSYSENFGNVVLEAMAAGCPVAVTPEVGAADIVRESGAGAVLDGDPAKLGAGLCTLIANPVALKRMGEKGREFVSQRYTWEAVSLQMEEAYRQAIAG
jgi:glycosyltransferase involved in cell wall biosynthesis